MLRLMYTTQDGEVHLVLAAPKASIETILGPMSQKEYEDHVIARSIPADALNVKTITEDDIPPSREFRAAWVDVTPDTKVNVDLEKAKALKLQELRDVRNEELKKTDTEYLIAVEQGLDLTEVKERKAFLRNATEPLKALQVSGVDDEEVLKQIKELAALHMQE